MKTNELTGPALDWAVHMVLNPDEHIKPGCSAPPYSSDWLWGGPIIEEEGISVWVFDDVTWKAENPFAGAECVYEGPTPLVAAMRCYVASKLGDTIEIPEE